MTQKEIIERISALSESWERLSKAIGASTMTIRMARNDIDALLKSIEADRDEDMNRECCGCQQGEL